MTTERKYYKVFTAEGLVYDRYISLLVVESILKRFKGFRKIEISETEYLEWENGI